MPWIRRKTGGRELASGSLLAALAAPPPAFAGETVFPPATSPDTLLLLSCILLPVLLCFLLTRRRRALSRELSACRQELNISRRRCQSLLENAGDAIFLIDPEDGTLKEVNKQAVELLGYPPGAIASLGPSELFPGAQARRFLRLVQRVRKEGYGQEHDLIFRRRDGSTFIGAVHARLGDFGDRRLVHGVVRDVTSIRRTQQELRRKNQDLTLVNRIAHRASGSHALKEMLLVILDEVIENFGCNGGGIFLLSEGGSSLELSVSRGIADEALECPAPIMPGGKPAALVAADGLPLSSADLQEDESLLSDPERREGWRGFQAIPLATNARTVGVLFIFTSQPRIFDEEEVELLMAIGRQVGTSVESAELFEALQWQHRLTEAGSRELSRSREQLQKTLAQKEEANRALERLDKTKSNFLALASHELRTPLTYVLSGTQLLAESLDERLTDDDRRALDAVFQGGKRLEKIVGDLLEVARIDAQKIYLAREVVDLPAILEKVEEDFRPLLKEREISLRLADVPPTPTLYGDPHHLGSTFERLVENAVKFTPAGGRIEIRGAVREAGEILDRQERLRPFSPGFFASFSEGPMLQVTVEDTGVGIAEQEQQMIFDKFYEVGEAKEHFTSRTRFGGKGVGLGLTLVKGLVEAHGGMTWVESPGCYEKGTGSAFHVLLPLYPQTGDADGK